MHEFTNHFILSFAFWRMDSSNTPAKLNAIYQKVLAFATAAVSQKRLRNIEPSDIAHTIMLRFAQKLPDNPTDSYLRVAVKNAIIDTVRQQKSARNRETAIDVNTPNARMVERQNAHETLADIFPHLTHKQREALRAYLITERRTAGFSEAVAAFRRVHRARSRKPIRRVTALR